LKKQDDDVEHVYNDSMYENA